MVVVPKRGGHGLPLVGITSRSNPLDQQCPVVQIGEEHPPAADSKAIAPLPAAFEAADIAATRPSELVNRLEDSLLGWLIEAGKRLQGLLRPFDLAISPRLAKQALDLFAGDCFAPVPVGEALLDCFQVLLCERLIVYGGRVEGQPEGISRLAEVFQEPLRCRQLRFWQFVSKGV
jgi:hypothetical protein